MEAIALPLHPRDNAVGNKVLQYGIPVVKDKVYNIYTHTTVLLLFWNLSGTTWVSSYQKGKTRKVKTNLDLLEQEIVGGSGICWAIYKSASHPRQPCQHPTTQFFTGRMPFLPPNQQCQSTEGVVYNIYCNTKKYWSTFVCVAVLQY